MTQNGNLQGNENTLGGILIGIGLIYLLSQFIPGIGSLLNGGLFVAGAFAVYALYSKNKTQWGWLIVAYVLALIGVTRLLSLLDWAGVDFSGAVATAGIGIPFVYVYVNNKKHWWALIPGGIFVVSGLAILLGGFVKYIPVIMVIAGIYILFRELSGNREPKPEASSPQSEVEFEPIMSNMSSDAKPTTGPDADN